MILMFKKLPINKGKRLVGLQLKHNNKPFTYHYGEWYDANMTQVKDPKLRAALDKHLPEKERQWF